MIAKGCTCKNSFLFPFAESDVVVIYITYQQNGKIVIEKELEDCTFLDGRVYVTLTQEDTVKFDNDAIVRIQIRTRLKDGLVSKTKIFETYTDELLKDEVI